VGRHWVLWVLTAASPGCSTRSGSDSLPKPRPAIVGVGTAPWSQQQYLDGVPVGPLPTAPAELEWRADTLLVRGPQPLGVVWPPRTDVQISRSTIHISVLWSTDKRAAETESSLRIPPSSPVPRPYFEIRLAPLQRGTWRVETTHRDSTGIQLAHWTRDAAK
jgi:hypothetical protein